MTNKTISGYNYTVPVWCWVMNLQWPWIIKFNDLTPVTVKSHAKFTLFIVNIQVWGKYSANLISARITNYSLLIRRATTWVTTITFQQLLPLIYSQMFKFEKNLSLTTFIDSRKVTNSSQTSWTLPAAGRSAWPSIISGQMNLEVIIM